MKELTNSENLLKFFVVPKKGKNLSIKTFWNAEHIVGILRLNNNGSLEANRENNCIFSRRKGSKFGMKNNARIFIHKKKMFST
ncbi:hypothetical protein TNCT_435581 [Trichonephila clavata]|uniref:Uncharacterized protein n=1 Tax=Trichonephila clavata TaxID=2740835 RepID=A0A8X6K9N1_TRICU|nr:hypothetical protein TNCT_435581 [Trichonephila clavata]